MFKKLKIAPKLIIAFVAVTIISSLSGVIGLILMKSSDASYSYALTNYGFSQGDIGLLMSALNDNSFALMNAIASTESTAIDKAVATMQEDQQKIDQYLAAVAKTVVTDEERACYDNIVKNYPLFITEANKVLDLARVNKNQEAVTLFETAAVPYLTQVENSVEQLLSLNINTGTNLSNTLTTSANVMAMFMVVLIIVSIAISISLAVFSARSISRPMQLCTDRLVKLSEGDLHTPVPDIKTLDETGTLARATTTLVDSLKTIINELTHILGEMAQGNFTIMHETQYQGDFASLHTSTVSIINSLNDTLSRINLASDQVAGSADQVSGAAQSLSQGATEQASSVEELAATITEISSQINETSANAQDANVRTTGMEQEISESNKKMIAMTQAMSDISNSSSEIGKIIKTIEDIAFQTNILALNAAVEAARAGAAGKGFAVVADEVRNLASKSAEASKSTASLIEASIQSVENGTRIADETAKALMSAVSGAHDVSQIVAKISTASAAQADAVAQVTTGIDQISAVVQTNSATAEESAAASEELSGQSQVMKGLVSRFKLRASNESSLYGGEPQQRISNAPSQPSPALSAPSNLELY